jgi:hypothetical protein
LLKLVEAERLVAIEELLAQQRPGGSTGAAAESSGQGPTAGRAGSAAQTPRSAAPERTLTPFERDQLRKRQNPAVSASADRPGASPADAVASGVGVQPSREENWSREVARRLEESSKRGLVSLITGAQWEFGEEEVRIRPASAGIAKILAPSDLQTLEHVTAEVLGRRVRLTLAEDVGREGSNHEPQTRNSGGTATETETERRVREDPEVREFERLFGKSVSGVRKWKG